MIYILKCSVGGEINPRFFMHKSNAIKALQEKADEIKKNSVRVIEETDLKFSYDFYGSRGNVIWYIEIIKPEDYLDVFR